MRVIKFRGLGINAKEFIYSMTIANGTIKRKKDCVYLEIEQQWYGINPETLGQYIELKDKKGFSIYEGDIVRPFTDEKNTAEIIFINGCFKIASKRKDNSFMFWTYFKDEIEIIGNIHENEELL